MAEEHITASTETEAATEVQEREHTTSEDLQPKEEKQELRQVPKDAKDFIIERYRQKNEKRSQRIADLEAELALLRDDQPKKEQSSEDLNPIAREVMEDLISEKKELEIRNWISKNPAFQEYEEKMITLLQDGHWKSQPAEMIAYAAAGPDLTRHLQKYEADQEALDSRPASNTLTGTHSSGKKAYWEMSDKEFKQEVERARRQ